MMMYLDVSVHITSNPFARLSLSTIPSLLSSGYQGLFPCPGSEADHPTPSTAEVKNAWSYNSIPKYAFMMWCSIKVQGQLLLYYTNNIFYAHCLGYPQYTIIL